MASKYATKPEIISLVNNIDSHEHLSTDRIELHEIHEGNDIVFVLRNVLDTIPKDNSKWFSKKRGERPIRPRYTKMVLDGELIDVVKCQNIECERIAKTVIKWRDFTIVHYRIIKGSFEFKGALERLSENDATLIRRELTEKTPQQVYTHFKGKYSRKQIENQRRRIKESKKNLPSFAKTLLQLIKVEKEMNINF